MTAFDKYREAIRMDEDGERHFSHAFFSFAGKYRIQLLGRYWFWLDDDKGREWEYAADSWDEMFNLEVEQTGMTLREMMERIPEKELEFE